MKVGMAVSYTMNLGNFQSAKFDITLSEIDADQPLEPQLAAAAPYIDGIAEFIEGKLTHRMQASGLLPLVRDRKP